MKTEATFASLSLAQYVALTATVPLPTIQQRDNFVDFVSHAHSWYKHLPYHLPGTPFFFFIDKYAGCDRVTLEDGKPTLVERAITGFHYSAIPTKEYRTRFGYLAFSCNRGTTLYLADQGRLQEVSPRDKVAVVPGDDAQMYWLPAAILDAGVVQLTAVINVLSAGRPRWDTVETWPEESGGQATLEKIVSRSRVMQEQSFKRAEIQVDDSLLQTNPEMAMHLYSADAILYELLASERQRQYREMRQAIDRVCEIINHQRKQLAQYV